MVDNILMLLIVLVTSPLICHRLRDMRQYPEKYLDGKPLSYYKEQYIFPWNNFVWYDYETRKWDLQTFLFADMLMAGYLVFQLFCYIF
ncbi:TPA: hypothetical protein TXJ06_001411 [Streptococcus suis]|nr:hypothetical protein [Streptococcus suis]MBY5020856.1 hypothetical protein [Streptococcus suis]HEL1584674.1 hypothetical protein [Streptococcus suis]